MLKGHFHRRTKPPHFHALSISIHCLAIYFNLYTMYTPTFQTPPPPTAFTRLAYPAPHVLLVTLSRPRQLNCINSAGHDELHHIWSWLDAEPSLRIGIVTGEGRAFCAGADLKGLVRFGHPVLVRHYQMLMNNRMGPTAIFHFQPQSLSQIIRLWRSLSPSR